MRHLLLCLALLVGFCFAFPAEGATKRINSNNSFQTFSYGSITSKRLLWDKDRKKLYAILRFTNQPYVLKGEYIQREMGLFWFSGVHYDESKKLFYVNSGGTRIPVAHLRNQVINTEVQPADGTTVYINKSASGKVTLSINASTGSRKGPAWVER